MDAFDAAFGGASSASAPSGDAFSAAFPTAKETTPETKSGFGAGFGQGIEDVFASADPIARKLDSALPMIGKLGTALGLPSGQQATDYHAANRQSFDEQFKDDAAATVGRVGGNIAASIPVFAAGGEVLGAAKAIPAIGDAANAIQAAMKGSKVARLGGQVATGAVQGAAGNALISSTSDAPISEQLTEGAELGGALGPAAALASKAGRGAANLITGGGVNPRVSELAKLAEEKYGIPVRGGQISESPFVKFADSSLPKVPFTGYAEKDESARSAFTRAVSKTFGADSDSLSPEVMSDARSRIGNVFDRVAQNTTIRVDNEFRSGLAAIEGEAGQVLPESEFKPIKNQLTNILSKVNDSGELTGDVYQTLTRKGAPLDRAMSSPDPNIRTYASAIRDTLDNALEKYASPEDLAALKGARREWKNMRTVQDLAAKSGIEGEITPSLLLNAVRKSYKDMAYSGAGDIGEIAQIGQQFLKPQASSGTAERLAFLKTLHTTGGALTAGLAGGAAATNPIAAAGGLAGLLGAAKLTGSVLDSKWYKNRLLASIAEHPEAASRIPPEMMQALRNYAVPSAVIGVNRLRESSGPVNP